MRAWVVALLVAASLAGCAGGGAATEQDEFSEDLSKDLQATSTTGIIRGVVIDETITPVEGAKVKILGQGSETTTNDRGEFGFAKLEAGTYFLEVQRFGFTKVQVSANVEAGVERPPIVRVQLARIPGLEPYSDTFLFEGFIQCSLAFAVNAIALCSVPEIAGVDLGDEFLVRYTELGMPPTHTQSEMIWESTQALGQTLKLRYTDDYGGGLDNYRLDEGQPPLKVTVDNATLEDKHFDDRGLLIRVFPSYAEPPGVVLILQQDFEIYTSVFYHYTPPEDWWFIESAQRPEPPQ